MSTDGGDSTTLSEVLVRLSATEASVDAVQRAAYRLSDRAALALEALPDALDCRLLPPNPLPPAAARSLEIEFRKQVLDEVLRERIRRETESVRNVILSLAFAQTDLVQRS